MTKDATAAVGLALTILFLLYERRRRRKASDPEIVQSADPIEHAARVAYRFHSAWTVLCCFLVLAVTAYLCLTDMLTLLIVLATALVCACIYVIARRAQYGSNREDE